MTSPLYNYFSNGIYFSSEIKFPELTERKGQSQIHVRKGIVQNELKNVVFDGVYFQLSDSEFLMNIESTAKYHIRFDECVTIEAYPTANEAEIRLYFLNLVLAVLLYRHKLFILHACCINVNGSAFLAAGDSGAGKSTLALSMFQKGHEILNDDISSIYYSDDEKPHVYAGLAHIKLMEKSLEMFGYKTQDFEKLCENPSKYSFPFIRKQKSNSYPIKAIFFISVDEDVDHITEEEIKGIQKIQFLRRFTFRYNLIQPLKISDIYFRIITKIANDVELYHIKRPSRINNNLADYFFRRISKT